MRTQNLKLFLGSAVVTLGGATLLQAQPPAVPPAGAIQPPTVQQFDQNDRTRQQQDSLLNNFTTTNAPELYPGENEDVGPQRILKFKPAETHFEAMADTQYAYTDNNRLDNHFRVSTGYAINTVQVAWAPAAVDLWSGKFAGRVGFRSQWYNYGLDGSDSSESALDFDGQTAFASGAFLWHDHWEFDAELDYTRLLSQANYQEFYHEEMPTLTVQRLFHVQDNLLFALSLQEAYHFSHVPTFAGQSTSGDVNDRADTILGATASWQLFGHLVLQPYYRLDWTHYPHSANALALGYVTRDDLLNIFGISATYYFTPLISARIYTSESFRGSDDRGTPTYSKFDTGLGINLTVRF